ncbi:MAG TPA: FAD-binding oxidoreductase [Candidatus Acidoferrales bacterium]|nr:FAD-binding oxidoreductase [Candidatus Acidoferrales bacterium]
MTPGSAVVSTRLAEIAGSAGVTSDPRELAAYQIDGKTPAAVVRPGSGDEVAEIVRFAAAERLAIVPAGARTKLAMGMPPRRYDLALDLTRLDRVVAYDPDDLTLAVEPGIPLSRLSGVLAGHKQFLPLAVPFMDRATMGGTIASGVDSPLRQFYGTARDFVLGMEFVTGEGVAARSGGRVVKNVSGYDIHKLMIGALGTLGVITKINLRTFPLARMTRTLVAAFRGPGGACEFRHAIARSVLRPQSLEIVAAGGDLNERFRERSRISLESGQWSVVASFAGDEGVLKRDRRELEGIAEAAGRGAPEKLSELSEQDHQSIATYVSDFPRVNAEQSRAAAIFKITGFPGDLETLAAAIQSCELPWAAILRGVGVSYLALRAPGSGDESVQRLKKECARVLGLSGKSPWGRCALLWCPPEFKNELNVWGEPPGDFLLMQKLKNVFDPHGILSPGRFVGGI